MLVVYCDMRTSMRTVVDFVRTVVGVVRTVVGFRAIYVGTVFRNCETVVDKTNMYWYHIASVRANSTATPYCERANCSHDTSNCSHARNTRPK